MYHITVQRQLPKNIFSPKLSLLKQWVSIALHHKVSSGTIALCLVSIAKMRYFNRTYRHKDKSSNVLAFPATLPADVQQQLTSPLLGDIIICPTIVNNEAKQQQKSPIDHWQHIVIHGTLHIIGYDHQTANEAAIMEDREINLLASLGTKNPYLLTE
jgi:probable rRNA maturation factor